MKIIDIITWVLFIAALLVVAWYFLGNSLTIEQTLLVLVISFLFVINGRMGKFSAKLNSLEKSFSHLAKDFKQHIKHK